MVPAAAALAHLSRRELKAAAVSSRRNCAGRSPERPYTTRTFVASSTSTIVS